ncbi:MAG: hypothetical protein HFP77_02720 [Methylococcales symbiont of Iophon sp. n. MRB-2018]|nr:MAG: hypothetical protein HFP77_02720 [Methylococcales symbiont of Iophon sp. n. MRB-2018]KAF3980407.1 MAG: hypothetical protein HFP76_02305 [Methylococcales symbiont of Iophon sp. n. MRB-2018]
MKQFNFNSNFTGFRKNLNLTEQDKRSLTGVRKIKDATIKVLTYKYETELKADLDKFFWSITTLTEGIAA